MRLTIEKLVYGGAGLARTDEGVVFVPRTAAGDIVEADVVEKKKDYATARVTKVLELSPDRQDALCNAGCCHWGHIKYERQVEYKEQILRESLQRIGKIRFEDIRRITGPDRNYRMRAAFHVQNGKIGFMEEKTNRVVPMTECASLAPELNQFISQLDVNGVKEVHAISGPAIAAKFVMENGEIKRTTIGEPIIRVDEKYQYRINPDTFFQANRFLLASFINEVLQQAGPSPKHILELYSGAGFFSIPLARISKEVIGVESNRAAIKQARENLRLNEVWNLEFFEGQVDATLHEADVRPDVVVLDPPRAGCSVKNAEAIARFKPRRIVYVSCNPTTFAREAAVFVQRGYEMKRLTLVDQFPNTYHIETVASFELR